MLTKLGLQLGKAALLAALLACGGGGGDGPTGPGSGPGPGPGPSPSGNTIIMGSDTFAPTSLTITTGGTVTWNNTSGVQHNVTFSAVTGAPANIGNHASGSNARTFATAGSFPFSCTLHGGMNGTIIVP